MKPEIEAKFLRVNPDDIRNRLERAGAVCKQPMQLMCRVVFENEQMLGDGAYLRVRDEGHRIAMTYKRFTDMSINGASEIEFTVSNFDAAVELLQAIGVKVRSRQEARREIWNLDDVEIVIDEWPWISPYIEIEAPSEEKVKATAKRLKLDWNDAAFGDVATAYRAEYPHLHDVPNKMLYDLPIMRHGDPLPAVLVAERLE